MKYTVFSLLIHLFVLIAVTACSEEAVIGDELSADREGKIMLSLPPSDVIEVRSGVELKETFIKNAYVLIFSSGSDYPKVESILQITGNGLSTSPTLQLQQNSPAPSDQVYVLCNVSYKGGDPGNFSDITQDNIDEKFPLTVSEELDFSATGLPMMGKIDRWPDAESASSTCEMHFAVAKFVVSKSLFGLADIKEVSFTIHNYVSSGNISYLSSGLNAVTPTSPNMYINESKKFTLFKEGDVDVFEKRITFYLFEYPSAIKAKGNTVDKTRFSVDRPYFLFEKKLKNGKIEYSRYDVYKGGEFLDLHRHRRYELSYKGQFGYDTKEMAIATSDNILYNDWKISDDWSSVIQKGPFAILTNKDGILPTIDSEITFDFELSSFNQFDVSQMARKILLHGPSLERNNIADISCTDKNGMNYSLTPIEGGYELPLNAVSKSLSLSIRLNKQWWSLGDKGSANSWLELQFGYLKKKIPFYPVEAANCYLAVGSGEDINIWLGQANGDNKQRIRSSDVVTAEVLWKDNPNLQVDFKIAKDLINVKPLSPSKEVGNMVIAAKVNGTIRWSWHLWYAGADVVKYNKEKGFYEYRDKYIKKLANEISMDRNLGALANYPNKEGLDVKGFYYQWERKDPIPDPEIYNNIPILIYGGDNTSFPVPFPVPSPSTSSPDENLEESIKNPLQTYINQSSGDWWATSEENLRAKYKWDKIYDPCPIGWCVPTDTEYSWSGKVTYNSDMKGYVGDEIGYIPLGSIWTKRRTSSNANVEAYHFTENSVGGLITLRYWKLNVRCVREL